MSTTGAVAAVVGGYLIGSISFARIVLAWRRPGEPLPFIVIPTTDGEAELVSGAIGGANVMMSLGTRWGVTVSLLDMAKAFVPVLALGLLYPGEPYDLLCGVAVLVGHLWPVWYGFAGGGGNSSIIGMLLAISPIGLIVTHAGGMLLGRLFPAVAYLAGVVLTVPWFWWRNGLGSPEFYFAIAITVIYLLGQLPGAVRVWQLKREGHTVDTAHVVRMMRSAAKTGRTGAELAEEQRRGTTPE